MEFFRQDTGVGSHSLLQGISPTGGLTLGLPHYRQILYHLSPPRKQRASIDQIFLQDTELLLLGLLAKNESVETVRRSGIKETVGEGVGQGWEIHVQFVCLTNSFVSQL